MASSLDEWSRKRRPLNCRLPRTRTTFATFELASLARNTSGQTSTAETLDGDAVSMKLSRLDTYEALKRLERKGGVNQM